MVIRSQQWLSTDRGRAIIILAALLLVSPALCTGLVADDLIHELMLDPHPGIEGIRYRPLDLFAFATGDAIANHQLMEEGVFPWWADRHVLLAFWRPLSSLSHLLNHWLWAHHASLMHLQSMAWFGAALVAILGVYRRWLVPPWVAGLALLLYAVDDARAPAVAWVANRNALVSMAFALPALLLHDRWRREASRRARWLATGCLAVGLLAGETACALVGYLVAYAVCLDRGALRGRALSLLPYAVVLVVWRILYVWTGHGVAGSGIYMDLGHDPIGFLRVTAVRLPLLLAAAILGPWADLWEPLGLLAPAWQPWLLGWSGFVLAAFGVMVWPLAKRDPVTRFFALGSVLATVPMCSTFVHDRLLMVPCIGTMALVARLIGAWVEDRDQRSRARTATVGILAMAHLVVAPILAPMRAYAAVDGSNRMLRHAYDSLPSDTTITHQTVILVNPPFDPFVAYFPVYRQAEHVPRPERLRWIANGTTPLRLQRVDERTLLVRAKYGWLSTVSERMLRDPEKAPARAGDTIDLRDVSFEVVEVMDGRPSEVRVRFEVPLDDPGFVWLQWGADGSGFVPFRPPPVGESVELDQVDMRRALLLTAGGAQDSRRSSARSP